MFELIDAVLLFLALDLLHIGQHVSIREIF